MKTMKFCLNRAAAVLFALGLGVAMVAQSAEPASGRLSDVIKSGTGAGHMALTSTQAANLTGYIALYDPLTSPAVDGIRAISFGVDINEAASGTEKAETQAVTVQYAWLEVTTAGGTKYYGKAPAGTTTEVGSRFYTETQATVAAVGSTTRTKNYTLLGRTGSAAITGATNAIQGGFDSTLKIVIPSSAVLSGATAAKLHVLLLDTNGKLGDPEAFYDFSGGYEDVAILNATDSKFLDSNSQILASRNGAPGVELSTEGKNSLVFYTNDGDPNTNVPAVGFTSLLWIQRPGAGNYNVVGYEDLYPNRGDYDFNDLVVAYNYVLGINGSGKVEQITATAYMLARGSQYTHDWTLTLPVTGGASAASTSTCSVFRSDQQQKPVGQTAANSQTAIPCTASVNDVGVQWNAFTDTVALFPGTDANGLTGTRKAASPINTDNYLLQGPKATLSMTLGTPILLSKFVKDDPWIRITRTDGSKDTVHLKTKDQYNFPYAMMMPMAWKWPLERVEIANAYPDFLNFVKNSGTTNLNWYANPVLSNVNTGAVNKLTDWTITNWGW